MPVGFESHYGKGSHMRRLIARVVLLAALVIPLTAVPAQARCTLDCLITHGCITTVDGSICY